MVEVFNTNAYSRFKRSIKRLRKQGKDISKLKDIIVRIKEGTLSRAHKDHALKGAYMGFRECHIENDWLLIYRWIGDDTIELYDTGTHQDLFGE